MTSSTKPEVHDIWQLPLGWIEPVNGEDQKDGSTDWILVDFGYIVTGTQLWN